MSGVEGSVLERPRVAYQETDPRLDFPRANIGARLVLGADLLNPRNKVSQFKEAFASEKTEGTISALGDLSRKERKDFYETREKYKNMSHADRMTNWKEKFSAFLGKKENQAGNKGEWSRLCERFNLKDEGGSFTAQAFYDTYLNGKTDAERKEKISKFAEDGLGLYKDSNGQVRYEGTKEDLEQRRKWIEQIGKMSLGDTSGTLMSILTDARAACADARTSGKYIQAANTSRNSVENERLLEPLWDIVKERVVSSTHVDVFTRPPVQKPDAVVVVKLRDIPVVPAKSIAPTPLIPSEEELRAERKRRAGAVEGEREKI